MDNNAPSFGTLMIKNITCGEKVVEDIIMKLNNKFRKEIPHTTTHDKVLEYLGMKFNYITKGKI